MRKGYIDVREALRNLRLSPSFPQAVCLSLATAVLRRTNTSQPDHATTSGKEREGGTEGDSESKEDRAWRREMGRRQQAVTRED